MIVVTVSVPVRLNGPKVIAPPCKKSTDISAAFCNSELHWVKVELANEMDDGLHLMDRPDVTANTHLGCKYV